MMRRAMWLAIALAVACGSDRAEQAREYLASGNRYAAQKQFKQAVIEYRNAAKMQPGLAEAYSRLGAAYLELGKVPEAYEALARAADLQPANPQAQLEVGTLLVGAGDFDGARSRAELALKAAPNSADAHILLATALAGLEKLDEAVAEAERATLIDPSHAPSFSTLGALQLARGKRADAERLLNQAIALEPNSARPRLALANFYWAIGDLEGTEHLLKEALEREPDNGLAHRASAMLYVTSGRAAAAEPHLQALARGPNPAHRLALADYYARMARPEDALRILQPLAEKKDTAIDALTRIASIHWANGRRAEASRVVDTLLAQHPKAPEAQIAKARLLLMTDPPDAAKALEHAEKAVKSQPDTPELLYVLGLAQAAARRYDDADRSFAEVLRLNPRAAAAEMQRSRLRLARGDAQGAVESATRAAETSQGDPAALLQLARSLRAAGRLDDARRRVAALEKQFPQAPAIHLEAGWIALASRDPRAARQSFERAAALGASGDAIEGLVALDMAEGRAAAARERIAKALSHTPDDPDLLVLAGRTAAAAGALDEAEGALKRAIQRDPDALAAYLLLADLYRSRGDVERARAEYRRAAASRPDAAAPAHTLLGLLEESGGRGGEAEREYRAALDRNPRAAVAANNLAWMYGAQGKLDEALKLAQVAARELPGRAEVQHTLGWIYLQKRLPEHAIPPLEKSIELAPGSARYHAHLGLAYLEAGRRDRARRALQRALAIDPKFSEAREALARLDAPRSDPSSGGSK